MTNNNPQPSTSTEQEPLDLGPIKERLHKYISNPFFAPGPINEDAAALIIEVERLRNNINFLIQKWAPISERSRDTLKVKDVIAHLEDALVNENYYAGE